MNGFNKLFGIQVSSVCLLWALGAVPFVFAEIDPGYELGAGDKLRIQVFEEPDMSFDVIVDNTGIFTYPYLGEIIIKGKTTPDIENELVEGLKGRVLINPNIAVSVLEYRPFSIGGEVKSPGDYPFQPNLTIQKAINLAGGVTEWSNGRRFEVEREKSLGNEKLGPETLVYPGDVVTILPRRF